MVEWLPISLAVIPAIVGVITVMYALASWLRPRRPAVVLAPARIVQHDRLAKGTPVKSPIIAPQIPLPTKKRADTMDALVADLDASNDDAATTEIALHGALAGRPPLREQRTPEPRAPESRVGERLFGEDSRTEIDLHLDRLGK